MTLILTSFAQGLEINTTTQIQFPDNERSDWYGFYGIHGQPFVMPAGSEYCLRIPEGSIPAGATIESVRFYHTTSDHVSGYNGGTFNNETYLIRIYTGTTYDAENGNIVPGTLQYSQNYTVPDGYDGLGINTCELSTPFTMPATGDVTISVYAAETAAVALCFTDDACETLNFALFGGYESYGYHHFQFGSEGIYYNKPFLLSVYYNDGHTYQPKSDFYAEMYDPMDTQLYPNAVNIVTVDQYTDSIYFYGGAFNVGIDSALGYYTKSIYIDGPTPYYFPDYNHVQINEEPENMWPNLGWRWKHGLLSLHDDNDILTAFGWPANDITLCLNIEYQSTTEYNGIDPNPANNTYCVTYHYDHNNAPIPFTVQSEDVNKGTVRILTNPTVDNPNAVLSATANECYRFDHWSTGSTENPYTLTITEGMTIIAYFVEEELDFYAQSEDESMGSVQVQNTPTCTNPIAVLNAIPNNGYRFDHWSTGSTDNPYTLIVSSNSTVITAYFVEDEFHFSAQSEDENKGTVQILTTPTETSPNAVLYAIANECYRFDHWSTGSTENPYVLTVTNSMDIIAYFTEEDFEFSAQSEDENMGIVQVLNAPTCLNPDAVLYAVPNDGYHFDHWSTNSTENPYVLTATEGMTVIGYFVSGTPGIGDNEFSNIHMYAHNGDIIVEGGEGQTILVFDTMGRIIHRTENATDNMTIAVSKSGIYLVQVGTFLVKKVVIIQ